MRTGKAKPASEGAVVGWHSPLKTYKAESLKRMSKVIALVNCAKCGAANKDDAKFCVSCGSMLSAERVKKRDECFGPSEPEKACFGLPYGGVIVGIIVGLFIVIWGLMQLTGQDVSQYIGPFILIMIGVLIVAGAIYGLSRRRY